MINIFGEEEFKPIKKFGIEVPDYFVSKDGRVLSTKTSKWKILNPTHDSYQKRDIMFLHNVQLRVSKKETPELFEEYNYNSSQQKLQFDPDSPYYKRLTKDPNLTSIQVKY